MKISSFLTFATLLGLLWFAGCKNPCKDVNCQNGGQCVDGNCQCADGFYGTQCEKQGVACAGTYCLNGGTCVNNSCNCPPCYAGASCELNNPDHYIGFFTSQELCDGGNYTYQVAIQSTTWDGYDVVIYNLAGISAFAGIQMDGCSFSIPLQPYGTGNISGSGAITDDGHSINMSYNISFSAGTEGCVATLTRQ